MPSMFGPTTGCGEGSRPASSVATSGISERLAEYLSTRHIDLALAATARIDICPEDGPRPGWIRIPYLSLTKIWGYRYRVLGEHSGGPKYWSPPGQDIHLYNPFGHGPHSDRIVFCEGEFDTLAAESVGANAVGIPGVGITDHVFSKSWARMFDGAELLIAFDGDDAGRDAALRLRDGLRKLGRRATIVDVPDGLDLNSWLIEDREGLRKALEGGT